MKTPEHDVLSAIDAQLSPDAKHAYETYMIAFWRSGQEMTMGQLRAAIRGLYGEEVDHELEQYIAARVSAIIPH